MQHLQTTLFLDGAQMEALSGRRLTLSFFCSKEALEKLLSKFPKYPNFSYQAVNQAGDHFENMLGVSAVTWGVWPSSEVKQPTIVDPECFLKVWKDEAFTLWKSQWASLYKEGTPSNLLLNDIANTYYLVNIVDNDFTKPDTLFLIFDEIIQEQTLKVSEEDNARKVQIKKLQEEAEKIALERLELDKLKLEFEKQKKEWLEEREKATK